MKLRWIPLLLLAILISCSSKESSSEQQNITAPEVNNPEKSGDSAILGIDVSHFQGDIDWQEIKDAQISFVYDKATQGARYKDPDYVQNKAGAHSVDLLHGSYHFFTSDEDAKDQAEHFITVVDYVPGDMPPVLDLEQDGVKGTLDIPNFQKEVLTWLNEVESKLGVKPIIYTNHPFGDQYLNHPEFLDYELWIAEYDVEKPKIPQIWQEKGWLIWQRSDRGKVEGVVGDVDHDLFNPQKPFNLAKK